MSGHDVLSLSFVSDRKKPLKGRQPRNFWNVTPTGDYGKDCETGSQLALEWIAYEEANIGGPGILSKIVEDMPRELSGVEIGFLGMAGIAARAGAGEGRRVAAYWDDCKAKEEA